MFPDKQGSLYFPSDYPTSCLLGCVNVVDCLSQDDYKENVCEPHTVEPLINVLNKAHPLNFLGPKCSLSYIANTFSISAAGQPL